LKEQKEAREKEDAARAKFKKEQSSYLHNSYYNSLPDPGSGQIPVKFQMQSRPILQKSVPGFTMSKRDEPPPPPVLSLPKSIERSNSPNIHRKSKSKERSRSPKRQSRSPIHNESYFHSNQSRQDYYPSQSRNPPIYSQQQQQRDDRYNYHSNTKEYSNYREKDSNYRERDRDYSQYDNRDINWRKPR
jgi:hypothetical protein